MGAVCFSSSSTELVGRNTTRCVSIMMYKVCAALLLAGAALASPVAEASHGGHGGHGGHGHKKDRVECHVVYDIVHNKHCETCQQVHHSSAIVGHDSQLIHGGRTVPTLLIPGHYAKRDAKASPGGYSTGPVCQEHVERQCHKVPQAHERKVPRPVCHSVPREQCHPTAHKVAREVCQVVDKKGRPYGYGHH